MENKLELDELVTKINQCGEWCEEYYTENTDNGYAEFTASFCYGEVDRADIDRRIADIDNGTMNQYTDKLDLNALADHCDLVFIDNYNHADNEIFSVPLVELEDQLPPEIEQALAALNAEEVAYIEAQVDHYLKDECIYINLDYSRWAMILNTEKLGEAND